jgi:hypothetical protein
LFILKPFSNSFCLIHNTISFRHFRVCGKKVIALKSWLLLTVIWVNLQTISPNN